MHLIRYFHNLKTRFNFFQKCLSNHWSLKLPANWRNKTLTFINERSIEGN